MNRRKLNIQVPSSNLAQFQIDRMAKYMDMVAMVDPKNGIQYTYGDVIDRIQRLAAGLQALGMRQGDVLCALTFNTIEYPIIWYAVNLLGATFQTASPLYTDADLERRFSECRTKFLVTIPSLTKRITTMIYNLKLRSFSFSKPNILNKLIVLGETEGYISYDSLFSDGKVTQPANIDPTRSAAILLSSSGTTGLPKFVKLSHVNISVNIMQLQENLKHRPGETTILALPVFHHFGVHTALGTSLYCGLRIVFMEKWHTLEFLQYVQTYKANILQIVPAMAARLVKHPDRSKFDISSVRNIQTAAAPMGPGIEAHLREMFKLKYISQGYGLTETGFNAGNDEKRNKPGSCGVCPSGVDLKIVDPETGAELPRGKTGEVVVGGPMISIGYLNNPEADKVSFDRNGYFKTGDLGYMDPAGFLFIVDRLKELIKFKGLQVAPAYLEDIIVKHAGIADVAVIGIPDEDAGELPKAFIVRQPGTNVSANEISEHVSDQVAPHMRLRGGVEFIEEIPRNPSGKILRRMLRDRLKQTSKL